MEVAGKIAEQDASVCYHCGEAFTDTILIKAGHKFCCNGCQTVFELLNESELCEYYTISPNPGSKQKESHPHLKYAFLDVEEIKKDLLLFSDGKLDKVKFLIPAIHCSSCIWLLENLYRLHDGIMNSGIHFIRKEVTITYNNQLISLRELAELLHHIGYAPDINLDSLNKPKVNSSQNNLSIKLGIAGFCFGNIMLLSFPEYFSEGNYLGLTQGRFFGYLNILLSLPVFFYSSLDYFESAVKGLRGRFINIDVPISIGIVVLFVRSVVDILANTGAGYLDSFTGLVFFLLIGKWFQHKTYQALSFEKDYKAYFPAAITRVENGIEQVVPLNKIRPGDILLIRNNELIPCDADLIDASANIDYSFVTGESMPVRKVNGDSLFAGGKAIDDSFRVSATREVSQSYLVELWNQDAFKKERQLSTTSLINKVSKYFTITILSIATLAGLYWWYFDPSKVWTVVTAVLIVACPCALALSVPFTFGNTIRIFGKRGFFMKNAESVEKLAMADTIVFDKTGTITDQQPVVEKDTSLLLSTEDRNAVYSICKKSFHPLSRAITAGLANTEQIEVKGFTEVPGSGLEGIVNGNTYRIGSAAWTGTTSTAAYDHRVFVAKNGTSTGAFSVKNHYRKGLGNLFLDLSKEYQLSILSGDNDREKSHLRQLLPENTEMFFRQSPYDKLTYIRKMQDEEHKVIMIGDGLNDAGALKQSDFGISVTADVHHFSPSCDAILEARSFSNLPAYLHFSKLSMKVVRMSILISFLYNIAGITLAVNGLLSPLIAAILMPLSSITVVVFITLSIRALSRFSLKS